MAMKEIIAYIYAIEISGWNIKWIFLYSFYEIDKLVVKGY